MPCGYSYPQPAEAIPEAFRFLVTFELLCPIVTQKPAAVAYIRFPQVRYRPAYRLCGFYALRRMREASGAKYGIGSGPAEVHKGAVPYSAYSIRK